MTSLIQISKLYFLMHQHSPADITNSERGGFHDTGATVL